MITTRVIRPNVLELIKLEYTRLLELELIELLTSTASH